MLRVSILKQDNVIIKIEFNGHAMFDVKGKDIVCASASVSLLTTVNAILEFDDNAIKFINNKNVVVENIKQDETTNKLLLNLENVLKELERQYKEYICINIKEEKRC
jgi:hypothetical protein